MLWTVLKTKPPLREVSQFCRRAGEPKNNLLGSAMRSQESLLWEKCSVGAMRMSSRLSKCY